MTYNDGSKPYKVKNAQIDPFETGGNYVHFYKDMLGVLSVDFDGSSLPWEVLERVRVDCQYDDMDLDPLVLKADSTLRSIVKPLGKPVDKPLKYKVTFYLPGVKSPLYFPADGNSFAQQNVTADDSIEIPCPFGGHRYEVDCIRACRRRGVARQAQTAL